jgi:predicted membrane-bound spermidine synthase
VDEAQRDEVQGGPREALDEGTQSSTSRAGIFVLAFASGFAVLTIEIAGARLIAPVFGLSAVPWTAVIGVILAALAAGSHLGGRLADEGRVSLSSVLLVAAVTAALPILGGSFPWMAREILGFIPGAVVAALFLFAPSVLCLGAVVPFLVQADTHDLANVGRRAGDVSAAATAGSIMGSFVTGFVLLPLFPLPVLMGLTAGLILMLAALAGVVLGKRVPVQVLILTGLGVGTMAVAASQLPDGTLHREQTLYSAVAVTERDWGEGFGLVRELWQNGGSSSAEIAETGTVAHPYAIVSAEILSPIMNRIDAALVLGGAALSLPVALIRAQPGMRVDVVEIDPAVTDLARQYFAFGREDFERMRVVHEDARVFLRASDAKYDLVYLDVFDHLLTVPWTMVTEEALTSMSAHLEPDGLFMANVLSPQEGAGTEFLARFRTTLEAVFPEVRIYRANPGYSLAVTQNLIVVAALQASALPGGDWVESPVLATGRPLTDAWAPVEYLQAKVFLEGLGWD